MDYLAEIQAFYDWLEYNPVGTTCISLWHALMHIADKAGWRAEFTVAISTLELKTGLKKNAIYRARNTLRQMGLIDFKERKGCQSSSYTIRTLCPLEGHKPNAKRDTNRTQCETQTERNVKPLEKKVSKKEDILYKKSYSAIVENYSSNENVRAAIWAYIQMRIKKKAAPTDHALDLALQRLSGYSQEPKQQVAILDQSTRNNWTDLYPLKEEMGRKENGGSRQNTGDAEKPRYGTIL